MPRPSSPRTSPIAFTLIELLIVVAIIAILAAIAVPNFLEAQTRAKVSRVKTDMRSIATAVEAYHVDHNKHPISGQYIATGNFNSRLFPVTTPIAYISSLPVDVFFDKTFAFPVTPGVPPTFEYNDYTTAVIGENFPGLPSFNLFTNRRACNEFYRGASGGQVEWSMHSSGPDQVNDFQNGSPPFFVLNALQEGILRIYDPSNGTVSAGDIVRTNLQQRN